jgi:hypothetical protein
MRIRVVRRPTKTSIDGLRLDHFEPGWQYDVGNVLGALMLAERWAEPVPLDEPALVPFSETDPYLQPSRDKDTLPNVVREHYPPFLDTEHAMVAGFLMRRRPR